MRHGFFCEEKYSNENRICAQLCLLAGVLDTFLVDVPSFNQIKNLTNSAKPTIGTKKKNSSHVPLKQKLKFLYLTGLPNIFPLKVKRWFAKCRLYRENTTISITQRSGWCNNSLWYVSIWFLIEIEILEDLVFGGRGTKEERHQ